MFRAMRLAAAAGAFILVAGTQDKVTKTAPPKEEMDVVELFALLQKQKPSVSQAALQKKSAAEKVVTILKVTSNSESKFGPSRTSG